MNQQNLKKKKNKKREHILWLCIGVALLAICGTILGVVLHEPSVETVPNFPTDGTTTGEHVDVSTEPYERKEGYYTFLIAGVDDVSMSTDVMMLASLDTENKKIHVVQLPRDTFVNAEVGGFTTVHRVNAVFTGEYNRQVNKGISQKTAKTLAMQALCDRLETQLCITIDEYVLINTSGFCSIIDAVGGIDFDVPFDMFYEDPEQDLYIDLKAGYQHLDGKQCESLIRYRDGYSRGDIERMEMRADFMSALFSQVKANINLDTMLNLIRDKALLQKMSTSMSLVDLLAYVKMVYTVRDADMDIRTIAGEVVQNPESGLWLYFVLNKGAALSDINECLNVYKSEMRIDQFDKTGFFTDSVHGGNAYIHEYYLSDIG
ncbi:MAG: LCP family protein [Clostridia bacterium]|nr:LCP family protein [Clostridia bacterium]